MSLRIGRTHRDHVLIDMAIVGMVKMAAVQVIDMPTMFERSVAAICPMFMVRVVAMQDFVGICTARDDRSGGGCNQDTSHRTVSNEFDPVRAILVSSKIVIHYFTLRTAVAVA